jgi:hypothetical protein
MNKIIKQYIELGRVIGVKNEDLVGQFAPKQQTIKVKAPEPQPVIAKPYAPTAEDALRLHEKHGNWSTVAKLMGKRKADVLALVHKANQAPALKVKEPEAKITVMEATKRALNSKRYSTMKEVVAAVKAQDTIIPVFTSTVRVYVNDLVRTGEAKKRQEMSQPTGYKLVDMHVHTLARAGQVKVHKEAGELTGYKLVG